MTEIWRDDAGTRAYRIAVDYGTTNSGAAIADLPDGFPTMVFPDGKPTIPSLVVLSRGMLVAGQPAENSAAANPGSTARTPKRDLGGQVPSIRTPREVSPEEAVAATLTVLLRESAALRDHAAPAEVVLTHPARWSDARQAALRNAAQIAGVDGRIPIGLLSEPVAAALRFSARDVVKPGEFVAIYDLGAGTFDTAILERTAEGFELHGAPGGEDGVGGELFDDLLYERLLLQLDPEHAEAMRTSQEPAWVAARSNFRLHVRAAKEALSSQAHPADVPYPVPGRDPVFITRDELVEVLQPHLRKTIEVLDASIEAAGLTADRLSAIYLVGGSSKIPLVQDLVTERYGKVARAWDDRKQVVALGAAGAPATAISWGAVLVDPLPEIPAPLPPPLPPDESVSEAPGGGDGWRVPPPAPKTEVSRTPKRLLLGGGAALAVVIVIAALASAGGDGNETSFPTIRLPAATVDSGTFEPDPPSPDVELTFEPETAEPVTPEPAAGTVQPASGVPTSVGSEADDWLQSVISQRAGVTGCQIQILDATEEGWGAISNVGCDVSGLANGVGYYLFATDADLSSFMESRAAGDRVNRSDVCKTDTWSWSSDTVDHRGSKYCFQMDDFAWVQWTEDEWRVFGNIAEVADVEYLYKIWNEQAVVGTPDNPTGQ